MEEVVVSKSQYAYFSCGVGLFRVKISNIQQKPEFQIEHVLYHQSDDFPRHMGLFSHHNIIYMVGGEDEHMDCSPLMFMFEHNKFQKSPDSIKNLDFLEKPHEACTNFQLPMVHPGVIPGPPEDNKIYFFSDSFLTSDDHETVISFQSFNTTKNCFEEEPHPPFDFDDEEGGDPQYSHFLLGCYLYFFVWRYGSSTTAFTFNTITSEWNHNESLMSQFDTNDIPPPHGHNGDVGLSDEYGDNNTRILVALCGGTPTAYRIRLLSDWGSFEPISYRSLDESHIPDPKHSSDNRWTRLASFGGGRFCMIYGSSHVDLHMYVFSIDFALEHEIQITDGSSTRTSSEILSYRIFRFGEDLPLVPRLSGCEYCFLSSSPSVSPTAGTNNEQHQEMDV